MIAKRATIFVTFSLALTLLTTLPLVGQESAKQNSNPFSAYQFNALFNQQVQAQLELVEEQRAEIRLLTTELLDLRKQLQQELREFAEGASEAEVEMKREAAQAQLEELKSRSQQRAMEVLLPHQQKLLSEVTVQLMLRESAKKNGAGVLAPEMRQYLEIDDEQAERIRVASERVRKKLAEDIKKLTEQATAELQKELTPEQRRKYRKLVGQQDPEK